MVLLLGGVSFMVTNPEQELLDKYASKLIDNSKRNILLNFRPSKTKHFQLLNEPLDQFFDQLIDEKTFYFKWEDDEVIIDDEVVDPPTFSIIRNNSNFLTIKILPEEFYKRLNYLLKETNTLMDERSINVLFIAFGFLEYKESPIAIDQYKSPIVLVPISINYTDKVKISYPRVYPDDKRIIPKKFFSLSMRDEDIVTNPSLINKMDKDFNIAIPEYDNENLDEYFNSIQELIRPLSFSIIKESYVGFFTFHKFSLYNDLKKHKDLFLSNDFYRKLINDKVNLNQNNARIDDFDLDNIERPIETIQVLEADSSQRLAIQHALRNYSFILKGPPGTGKSQTIANIISEFIFRGKRILFVSEKKAALDVVYKRLADNGLSRYLLDLHDPKSAQKKEFYQNLLKNFNSVSNNVNDHDLENLFKLRQQLNSISEEINKKRPEINKSIYEIIGELMNIENTPLIKYNWNSSSYINYYKTVDLFKNLERYSDYFRDYSNSNWSHYEGNLLSDYTLSEFNDTFNLSNELNQLLLKDKEYSKILHLENLTDNNFDNLLEFLNKTILLHEKNNNFFLEEINILNVLSTTHESFEDFKKSIIPFSKQYGSNKENDTYLRKKYTKEFIFSEKAVSRYRILRECNNWLKRNIIKRSSYNLVVKEIKTSCIDESDLYGANYITFRDDLKRICDFKKYYSTLLSHTDKMKKFFPNFSESGYYNIEDYFDKITWIDNYKDLIKQFYMSKELPFIENFTLILLDKNNLSIIKKLHQTLERICAIEKIFNDLLIQYFSDYFKNNLQKDLVKKLDFLTQLKENLGNANNLISITILLRSTTNENVQFFNEVIKNHSNIKDIYKNSILSFLLNKYELQYPHIQLSRDTLVENFKKLDSMLLETASRRLLASKNNSQLLEFGEGGFLYHEARKKRKHAPIRVAFKRAAAKIMELRPVIFMSPLSLSYFIDPSMMIKFDLGIFDEASQIKPEEAIGTFIRCKQIIIVGDDKQMPPTAFFDSVTTDEDYVESEDEYDETKSLQMQQFESESILDACLNVNYPLKMLKFHYRSKHESLIAFSNANFYNNELVTFPSPINNNPNLGIELVYVPEGIYDRGKSRKNVNEARKIVEIIKNLMNEQPNLSLGVVAFSKAQQDAIEDQIELDNDLFNQIDNTKSLIEPVFIKNLETVQGDERDVIIISVGYGKDTNGKFSASLGPLSQRGGERRLNVLISRARAKIFVVTSVSPQEWDRSSNNPNYILFKNYILFAHTKNPAYLSLNRKDSEADFDSPFEQAVFDFLRSKGFQVEKQVGVSGYKIDLAIIHPDTEQFTLAIECDGASYHKSKNARDRDRLRQSILEKQGWKFHRIWSTDWFHHRVETKKKLVEAVERSLNEQTLAIDNLFQKNIQHTKSDLDNDENTKNEDDPYSEDDLIPSNLFTYDFEMFNLFHIQKSSLNLTRTVKKDEMTKRFKITSDLKNIIQYEYPIHIEILYKRLLDGWNQEKMTQAAREKLKNVIEPELTYNRIYYKKMDIIWPNKQIYDSYFNLENVHARNMHPYANNKFEYYPVEMIAVIIIDILSKALSISEEELYTAISRVFNKNRLLSEDKESINDALNHLRAQNKIQYRDDLIKMRE